MDTPPFHFASLYDSFPLPIIELALPEAILSPNPAATAVFPDLLTVGLAHPAVQGLPALAAQMHTAGVSVVSREVQVGETQFHQLIVALPDRQALRAYMLDITPRTVHDAQIQQAYQMEAVGRLAGGVAHHLNNLLTVILGYAELLAEELTRRLAVDKVRAIQQAGEQAAVLVEQLLVFSRLRPLAPQVVQLNTLVRALEPKLRSLLRADIVLTTILDPHLGIIEADPHQLEQALIHLVANAQEAMPTGGHLIIETRNVELAQHDALAHPRMRPGAYGLVAVHDMGGGMDAATQARMFEPFFTTKPVGQGIGLSLAMVHGTITQSGGHIAVASGVGQGTTVALYLPLLQSELQRPTVESGTLLLPRGIETILLVEAEPRGRLWARRILEVCGYTVLGAGTGEEALELVEHAEQPVHILVTDVVLPRMSGPQLAAQVTARYAGVKLLYMADALEEADIQGLGAAGGAVVQKPIPPVMLARKVREILNG